MKAVFDTNILIDYLNGRSQAAEELQRYSEKEISIITWMEVLAGAKNDAQETIIRRFLHQFTLVPLRLAVAETAVDLRKTHQLKLPNAIIYATARASGTFLVTRNTKDFKIDWPDIRLPYQL